ncbi:hydrogenase [Alkalispirochaeta sphaeroplastigenens]|uniref:Hydrogenase n=1 Tax=Alkalispirochaeta sphaeroplastigenens TaxID=1187066 RepID=A0A2S4JMC1_9SPIO|nr:MULTISPECIES: hydrogenase subunit MbhD domain-containing protein [Alkalispirochaeta]POR00668.1 hydrogenase [Alkalispirochaeta sphaeroplastigenens]
MIELLLSIQLIIAVLAVTARKELAGVLALGLFSLVSTVLFYLMEAPDVALTEAAVGAGVTTLIFVWVLRHTRSVSGRVR